MHIRQSQDADLDKILGIVNEAAQAYHRLAGDGAHVTPVPAEHPVNERKHDEHKHRRNHNRQPQGRKG